MKEAGIPKSITTAVIVGLLPLASLLAWALRTKTILSVLLTLMSYFAAAASVVLARHDEAFLWWERLRRWVLNTTCRWSFTARYEIRGRAVEILNGVVSSVLEIDGATLLTRDERRAAFFVSGVGVDVRLVSKVAGGFDEEEAVELVFDVPDSHTPYRHLRGLFEERLAHVLEEVRRVARPRRERYELLFAFPEGANPYFGLFVRRLEPRGDFRWDYTKKLGKNGLITVTNRSVSVVTQNSAELATAFRRLVGLSLSPVQS